MRADRGALGLAALAGLSTWISLGVLAVTSDRGARIGALPPLWVALVCVIAAMVLAWTIRLRTSEAWPITLCAVLWLPWLPIRLPPAAVIWEGPLEGLVWVAVVLGLIVARGLPQGRLAQPWMDPRKAPWMAGILTLACSLAAAVALADRLPDGDEPHYLIITQSLLRDGDLRIENNHQRGDYLEYYAKGMPPDFLRRGQDEEIYSIHAPGLSALLAPAVAAAGYRGAVIFIALLCGAAVALIWRVAYVVTKQVGAAWAATLGIAFSAPCFLHTFTIFPDPVGAVIMAAAIGLLVQLDLTPAAVRRSCVLVSGTALAMLPWLHTRFALIAAVAGICILLRLLGHRDLWASIGSFLMVPALSAAAWFSYFWIIYGTANPAAPYGGSRQNSVVWMLNGVTGLLFDQQFGVLSNAPVMILVPVGLVLMWRERPRLTIEFLAIAPPYISVVASFAMWWGGWSAPGRFLVAVIPLAAPLLAYVWLRGGPVLRSASVALGLIGTLNVAVRVFANDGALLYNQRDGYDVLVDWLSPSVNLPLALPGVHRTGGAPALLIGLVWTAAAILSAMALWVLEATATPRRGARWALTGGVAVVAVAAAMSASWSIAQAAPLTPESSEIGFLARWQPDRRPLVVSIPNLSSAGTDVIQEFRLASSDRVRPGNVPHPLLAIARLPAGEYRLVIDGASELAGRLRASVGETPQAVETWTLDSQTSGETDLLIRLPTGVQSLVIRGDPIATSRITRLLLKPEHVETSQPRRFARGAARYGGVRAFALDDRIYVEPAGLWTRGNGASEVVFVTESGTWIEADLQTGPSQTSVELRSPGWSDRADLLPNERRRMRLPAGVPVTMNTIGAFRPVDYDPANKDSRPLGLRIEFPEQ